MKDFKLYSLLHKIKSSSKDTFIDFKKSIPSVSKITRSHQEYSFYSFFDEDIKEHIISIRKFDTGVYQFFNFQQGKSILSNKIAVNDIDNDDNDNLTFILNYGREVTDSKIKDKFKLSEKEFNLIINFLTSI